MEVKYPLLQVKEPGDHGLELHLLLIWLLMVHLMGALIES